MKSFVIKAAAVSILIAISSFSLYAQGTKNKFEFGVNLGMLIYQGDLSEGRIGSFRTQKLMIGLHADRLIGNSFTFRLNFTAGKLKGDDAKYKRPEFRRHRNFNFTSPVYEFSGRLLWDPTGKNYSIKGIAPYVFAGIGISFLDIKRDWSQLDIDYFPVNGVTLTRLPEDQAATPPGSIPVFPLGGGVKYFLSPKWALNGEIVYRLTSNDYIDGFSRAANPEYNDGYMSYSAGIIYRPGKKDPLSCPRPKY